MHSWASRLGGLDGSEGVLGEAGVADVKLWTSSAMVWMVSSTFSTRMLTVLCKVDSCTAWVHTVPFSEARAVEGWSTLLRKASMWEVRLASCCWSSLLLTCSS